MSESNEESSATSASPAKSLVDSPTMTPPRPINPPPPTVWPFVTAVGMTTCFWGVELNLTVICVGAILFAVGMTGFIGDWIREHRSEPT